MPSWKRERTERIHRERPQPENQKHLGFLERKKDYKKRAEESHEKRDTITKLKRKAEDRNPDEFYFNMTRTQKKHGIHRLREEAQPVLSEAQEKLMDTQDRRYVLFRLSKELKKIEKCKQTLHMIDSTEKKNEHTVFVDTEKDVESFDAAKYFDTHPAFVDRTYNRPHLDSLKNLNMTMDSKELEAVMASKNKAYQELTNRIERAKELKIVADKLEAKIHATDNHSTKEVVAEETKHSATQYKFAPRRKK